MPRTHFKERSKKGRIDLTSIGREEIIAPAIATKDQWLKEKYPEAQIVDPYEEPPVEIPVWYPETKRVSVLDIIKSEALNLLKI